jgi:hypothetical protein
MTFCIRGEGGVGEAHAPDIDRALCGECEKPLRWEGTIARCCDWQYAYWTSTVSFHRLPLKPKPDVGGTEKEKKI